MLKLLDKGEAVLGCLARRTVTTENIGSSDPHIVPQVAENRSSTALSRI